MFNMQEALRLKKQRDTAITHMKSNFKDGDIDLTIDRTLPVIEAAVDESENDVIADYICHLLNHIADLENDIADIRKESFDAGVSAAQSEIYHLAETLFGKVG